MKKSIMAYHGMSRTVFVAGQYAIKFPSFRNGITFFVMGMLANLLEDERWRLSHHRLLMRVYFCFPFGLFTINRAYKQFDRTLTREEIDLLPIINVDNNGKNIGISEHGFVLLDYGNPDAYLVIP